MKMIMNILILRRQLPKQWMNSVNCYSPNEFFSFGSVGSLGAWISSEPGTAERLSRLLGFWGIYERKQSVMGFERFILAPFVAWKEKVGLCFASLSFSFIPLQTAQNDFFIRAPCGVRRNIEGAFTFHNEHKASWLIYERVEFCGDTNDEEWWHLEGLQSAYSCSAFLTVSKTSVSSIYRS